MFLSRVKKGTARGLISRDNFNGIFIPNFDYLNDFCEEKIKKYYQKQTQSKQLYKETETLLLEELELVNYKPKNSLTFKVTKKGVEKAKRFDAEYFQPNYEKIIEKIKNYDSGFDVVGNIVNWEKGTEVGSTAYIKEGKEFLRVSDFSIKGIEDTKKKISDKLFKRIKNDFQPKVGEILFTKDGTIGISYVLKEKLEGILCGAFLRLRLKEKYQDFEKECLSLIFNSIVCKLQVEQLSGGAIISHLKPTEFETFTIPLIKPQIQTQVAGKIQKSHKLRKEGKELLEEAKTKVEKMIEKKTII